MTSQPEKEIDEPVIIDFEQAQRFGVDGGAWTPHIVELSQWDQHETHPNAETAIDSQCVHDDSHIEAMKRNVFIQAELECKSLLLVKPERWKDNVDMTEDNLLITTPYVFGFALNWKAWGGLKSSLDLEALYVCILDRAKAILTVRSEVRYRLLDRHSRRS
jgi:hypothetical protein